MTFVCVMHLQRIEPGVWGALARCSSLCDPGSALFRRDLACRDWLCRSYTGIQSKRFPVCFTEAATGGKVLSQSFRSRCQSFFALFSSSVFRCSGVEPACGVAGRQQHVLGKLLLMAGGLCCSTCRGRGTLVLAVLLCFGLCASYGASAAVTQAAAVTQLALPDQVPDCTGTESSAVRVTGNCTWSSQHQGTRVVIQGSRPSLGFHSNESATPAIFAAAAAGDAITSTGELQEGAMTILLYIKQAEWLLLVHQSTLFTAVWPCAMLIGFWRLRRHTLAAGASSVGWLSDSCTRCCLATASALASWTHSRQRGVFEHD